MNTQRGMWIGRAAQPRAWRALLCAGALSLGGCSGSGSVNVASGQSADPETIDFPIFYVKRPVPASQDDLREVRDFLRGADLYKRERATPSATETNITERITGTDDYDVKDLSVSADGQKLLFAMRGPLTASMDEEDPPTWNIWEYDIPSDALRRVIASDLLAEEGHDVAPVYLPDGRILFSSTRQRQSKAILLDENKPQFEAQNEDHSEPAFVLHVMNEGGSDIRQISFNQSHDLHPTVLASGRVLWSRWDHAPGRDGMHLYTSNPDGTGLELHYGANSHDTGTSGAVIHFARPREMQDGRILALIRPYTGTDFGGDLVAIDTGTYVENTQPTLASQGMSGPAQTRATAYEVLTIPGASPGGRFNSADPLWDGTGRILVSWSQCRLLDTSTTPSAIVPCTEARLADPDATPAPTLYSAWMFDPAQNTLRPLMQPTENVMITDVVAAQPRPRPAIILDQMAGLDLDADLVAEGVGVLHIRSVYDFDGVDTSQPGIATLADPAQTPAAQRPARFLRIEKAVSIPDDDVRDVAAAAFGASRFMREIIGYAPIEPDGSVRIKVPADVAFQISVLDGSARRIAPIHRNWLQVRPGEVLECNGCHTPATTQSPYSHGRGGLYSSVNAGAATTGVAFANTVVTFSPTAGETMAETRARTSCASGSPRCEAMNLSLDVTYIDVWTDPAVRAPDAAFSYRYGDLSTEPPASTDCVASWSSTCRIVINYVRHIQPLWNQPRPTPTGDHTCARAGCHNRQDAMGQTQLPAGQLELTDGPSDQEPRQPRSYRELLFTDDEQEVNMGELQDRRVPGPIDPATGQPTLVTVQIAPPMSAGNARGSTRFFSRFAAGGSHAGYLTAAELRLLSEWLDIGAQYFNNPFDPGTPVN